MMMTLKDWAVLLIGVLAFLLLAAGGGPLTSRVIGAEAAFPPPGVCFTPDAVLSQMASLSVYLNTPMRSRYQVEIATGDTRLLVQFAGDPDVAEYRFHGDCLVSVGIAAPAAAPRPGTPA